MTPAYTTSTSDFLAQLEVVASSANTVEGYAALCALFSRFLLEATEQANVTLVGTFAKVDYLLKTHHANARTRYIINNTRVHLREVQDEMARGANPIFCLTQEEFKRDLAGVRMLVQLVCQQTDEATSQTSTEAPAPVVERRRSADPVYSRMVVAACDDHFIYGRLDSGDEVAIQFPEVDNPTLFGTPREAYDYIHEGCQLNLIEPRKSPQGEFLTCSFVVYEPDYLIDISALSRCVEDFGDSPDMFLLNKLGPSAQSEAIMLGNLSGQLLDEELHMPDAKYSDSALRFFHHNALSLLASPPSSAFHTNAMQQLENIRAVLHEDLPQAVGDFKPEEVMVEPSFFSEMLGLQGRMDFLQLDMRVLIEQKSGKGAFVPHDPDPETPKLNQQHYVQLLLYMALLRYNYRSAYEANNRELYAYVMYSRYRKALQGLGFAPALLRRAFRLRNRIVHAEMRYAQEGFAHLLTLTADQLNETGIQTPFWKTYKRAPIEELLTLLRNASPLEQAYVLRFLQFVAREQLLDKVGNQVKEASGVASIWQSSMDEKLEAGNIMVNLTLNDIESQENRAIADITLHTNATNSTAPTPLSNFRIGDIVFFYPYEEGTLPDARQTMVFRATISELHPDRVVMRLRAEQTDAQVFLRHKECPWAIEHDSLDSAHTGLYRSVYSFLSAPKERRDLLLFQREPKVTEARTLRGDYGQFNDLQLRVKQADELFLIIGPPGTGKTSFGMLNTLQEQLLEPDTRVLIMSYTNRAVDEVCSKLVECDIPFLRIGNEYNCAEEYRSHLWSTQVEKCANLGEVRTFLFAQRVIVGTTATMTARPELFQLLSFDLAIIDEASQILEPHLLGLLSATHDGKPAIRKFVMIGDHKQLPAVVQQTERDTRIDDPQLQAIGLNDCASSLFERLLRRYRNNPATTYMLTRQGRMHPLIAEFPNASFYEGRLTAAGLPHQLLDLPDGSGMELSELIRSHRVVFLPVAKPAHSVSDKVNEAEADLIAQAVECIYRQEQTTFDPLQTIGIIVPYRNQISAIRSRLARLNIPALMDITIDTVERYQGSQRRYIIYGFTVQQPYQLKFLTSQTIFDNGALIDRKLNVVMTRAQEHLILLGNPALLSLNPLFARLIKQFTMHKA